MAIATSKRTWVRDWKGDREGVGKEVYPKTLAGASLKRSVKERYKNILGKIKMPPSDLDRRAKREFISLQLEKNGVSKYTAYLIASSVIKK